MAILRWPPEEGQMCGEASNLKILLPCISPTPVSCISLTCLSCISGRGFTDCTADTIQLQSMRRTMMDDDLRGTNPNFCQFYPGTRPHIYFSSDSSFPPILIHNPASSFLGLISPEPFLIFPIFLAFSPLPPSPVVV